MSPLLPAIAISFSESLGDVKAVFFDAASRLQLHIQYSLLKALSWPDMEISS
jgi:hypothetical protein